MKAAQPNCNLKEKGIRMRQALGVLGAVATIWATLLYFFAPTDEFAALLVVLILLSSSAAAMGFIQARLKFCAAFGFAGVEETDDDGNTREVANQVRKAQVNYALKISLYAAIISFCVTAIAYLVKIFLF